MHRPAAVHTFAILSEVGMRPVFVLLAFFPVFPALAASRLEVTVAPSLVKVRPTKPLPPEARNGPVHLEAVRGECEGAHVVVSATDRAVSGLTAAAADLKGPGKPLPVALYREAFLDVKTPSNAEGDAGPWPDALIPAIDPIAGERRNAFPVDVRPHTHQPVFVEICVPRDAAPGTYEGSLDLAAKGRRSQVPLRIDVLPLQIPATSSMPMTLGLSGKSLLLGHYGEKRGDSERLALVDRYARLALRYRVSLHTMSRIPPAVSHAEDGSLQVDFAGWDKEVLPFLDGSAGPDGARFSAIDVRLPDDLPKEQWKAYVQAFSEHVRAKGFAGPLFTYVMDEPKPQQKQELASRLDALAGTGALRLVTMPLDDAFAGKVDLWVPNLNCFAHKEKRGEFCAGETPREGYAAREAKGDSVWWYQSCSSHGCGHGPFGDARDRYFSGWPSYMVDIDGASARVMGWLAFANDIGGELYFDGAAAYGRWDKGKSPRIDPWDDQFLFGGDGDGTLFYPGRPDRIGGKTDVPVASLRLALIRDGLEDAELLRLLAARSPADALKAKEIARALAPKLFDFQHDPAAFAAARTAVLAALAPPGAAKADVRLPARP